MFSLVSHQFLQVHCPVDHDDADDRDAEGDLVGDHLRSRPQPAEQRVVVAGGKSREDDAVHAQGKHRKDIEQRHIDLGDLELDDAVAENEAVAERDGGKGHQSEEDREEGGERMKNPVGAGGNDILLGEHLDGVRKGMKEAHQPPSQNAGAVGPDPVLDDRRLFALQPGMQRREVQHPEEQEDRQSQLDAQVNHDPAIQSACSLRASAGSTSGAPWHPICS